MPDETSHVLSRTPSSGESGDRSFDDILDGPTAGGEPHAGPPTLDLSDALAELARIDLRTDDLPHVLQRIADLAQKTVPGAEEVSLSLVGGRNAVTPASTGSMALNADELQYAESSGPCLDASKTGEILVVDDFGTEQRWPDYVPRAREAGVGSSLSLGLPVQDPVTGALNVYSSHAHAFDEESVEAARAFAGYAAVAVANAQLYETTAALAKQMEEAMASRAVIEQAKGLIMGQRRCSADEAFALLVRASSRSNRKLRDIAAELIDSVTKR